MGDEDVNGHGNEYVDTRKGYVALATYGRVALILRMNGVIECDVKCYMYVIAHW
mgnify:CR=1 FL=1